ncbi:glutamate receptor ionotropic, kainate glr-3-like [Eriocheir sinensis]|uniref:glutamate receptor ionotropic, kainate glr-3-like n=1 Tax=Eriocheir sinensis TaxID=95602 RepID=UPI0021C7DB2C|nr:glutamate receptor ionotropic, kainate glr-3-like [Eriocheir sinensis]
MVQTERGNAAFQVKLSYLNSNATQTYMKEAVDNVRRMDELWHCLALVVVSDNPTFLAAFAHLSLRRHALRWSTKILVLTRLSNSELGGLHSLLSNRNAMLLQVQESERASSIDGRVGVYVWSPYSAPGSKPWRVATWTPHSSLTLASNMPLFPDKFHVFSSAPTLTVAIEVLPHNTISWVEDSKAPSGQRLVFKGHMDNIVKYLAKATNFTFWYVLSPERGFGTKLPDGSWTGMLGMVMREEADFSPAPFILSPVRKEAADHTIPYYYGNVRILSGLSGLKVDPWGFLLPLTPLAWAATLMALMLVFVILQLLPYCLPISTLGRGGWSVNNAFSCVRIILQQDIVLLAELWWWERLVLGLWMLTTLVVTKSYAGKLMSLLAVRYVPQPYQTLRDVLDDPQVAMLWQKNSYNEQYLRDVKTGIFREVAELEGVGRLKFHTQAQTKYMTVLDTLVRAGDHVIVDFEISLRSLMALDFSQKGQCEFYMSKDRYLSVSGAVMAPKNNPLVHSFNKRLMTAIEQGLISYWLENVPNFTVCDNIPKKKLVTSYIFISNIWGVFALLVGGLATGLVVWCAELLVSPKCLISSPSPLSISSH